VLFERFPHLAVTAVTRGADCSRFEQNAQKVVADELESETVAGRTLFWTRGRPLKS